MVNATQQATTPPAQFYRLLTLKAKLGISGSHIWGMVKTGKFPKPIKLSENVTAWNAADVEAWAQSRIQARDEVLDMTISSKAVNGAFSKIDTASFKVLDKFMISLAFILVKYKIHYAHEELVIIICNHAKQSSPLLLMH